MPAHDLPPNDENDWEAFEEWCTAQDGPTPEEEAWMQEQAKRWNEEYARAVGKLRERRDIDTMDVTGVKQERCW